MNMTVGNFHYRPPTEGQLRKLLACMCIDERKVDAEWLLEHKECTDHEFKHDQ